MALEPLILIANPGSASRKYALFAGDVKVASLHFEYENGQVICTIKKKDAPLHTQPVDFTSIGEVPARLASLFKELQLPHDSIQFIGLRIVAPGALFLHHQTITNETVGILQELEERAPLHIHATLQEYEALKNQFTEATFVGLSDSAFHADKPEYAWNYGLPIADADRLDVKRFGYHGLSASAVVETLHRHDKKIPKLVVCHLGSGVSITAVHGNKSIDTTMGYSPLEGVVMATRSGSLDFSAIRVLKKSLHLDDDGIEDYLNHQSGLQGLAGASDIRDLVQREAGGDQKAKLALATYVFTLQKAVGQMTAALGGIDALVFTGTIGERSAIIRERMVMQLGYLDFKLDDDANTACLHPQELTTISYLTHSKPVYVVPTDEASEMTRQLRTVIGYL